MKHINAFIGNKTNFLVKKYDCITCSDFWVLLFEFPSGGESEWKCGYWANEFLKYNFEKRTQSHMGFKFILVLQYSWTQSIFPTHISIKWVDVEIFGNFSHSFFLKNNTLLEYDLYTQFNHSAEKRESIVLFSVSHTKILFLFYFLHPYKSVLLIVNLVSIL